ncbi:MAG: hypothetical protein KF901_11930 [Myxococcales bacterium]|nr:hypothetical protein [Myxococcales bacterium]
MSFDEVTPSLAEVLERHPRWRISFSGRARAWWVGAVGASLTVAVIVRGDVLAVAAAAVVGVGVARTWLAGRGDRIRRARTFDRRSVHQVRLDLSSPALAVCVDRAGGQSARVEVDEPEQLSEVLDVLGARCVHVDQEDELMSLGVAGLWMLGTLGLVVFISVPHGAHAHAPDSAGPLILGMLGILAATLTPEVTRICSPWFRSSVVFAPDGVRVAALFVPARDVISVKGAEQGLHVITADRRYVIPLAAPKSRRAWVEAKIRATLSASSDAGAELGREGRDFARWRHDLEVLACSGYRQPALPASFEAVLGDPGARPDRRLGAAIAWLTASDEPQRADVRARVADVARSLANARLATALVDLATGGLTAKTAEGVQ